MKLIQLLNHSPPSLINFEHVFFDGWHARVGQHIKKSSNKYSVECWLPCNSLKKKMTVLRNGMTYKAFPSIEPRFGCEVSPSILYELSKENQDSIFHIHGDRDILTYTICSMFPQNLKVIQHHGSSDGREVKYFNFLPIERVIFPKVDHFFVLSTAKQRYLIDDVGLSKNRVSIQTMGVDFSFFKPFDKYYARSKLGLPYDKKIILYVGKFETHPKGLDSVIRAYNCLNRDNKVALVLVGGTKKNSLYSLAKESTPYVFERLPAVIMPLFYSAADVFTWFCDYKTSNFGGIGISVVEALACGLPVVSSTLLSHPVADRSSLGFSPRNFDELVKGLREILNGTTEFKTCRHVAERFYDWNIIIKKTLKVYESFYEDV